jgi:hypothetical protein
MTEVCFNFLICDPGEGLPIEHALDRGVGIRTYGPPPATVALGSCLRIH